MVNYEERLNCKDCKYRCIAQFIPDEATELLSKNKTIVEYQPGEVIFKQSSFASKILYVTSGLIKVVKEANKGKSSLIKIMGDGEFISIPIHEKQQKYAYTAIALTEVKVCEIQESILHQNIDKNPKLFDYLNDQFYDDQQFLMNKLLVLATRNNHGKLASSLIYLNGFNRQDFSIFDFVSRKDLADFASISLESANKIMQELNNDKIITIDRKGLRINKLVLLEKLSDIG